MQPSDEMKKMIDPVLRHIEKKMSFDENSLEMVKKIHGGFSTNNFLVKSPEQEYLLRTYPGKEEKYSEMEFGIMSVCSRSKCAHLSPKTYFCDSSKSVAEFEYALYEFVSGVQKQAPWMKGKNDLVREHGKILRLIHDSLPKFGEEKEVSIREAPEEDFTLYGQWDKDIISRMITPSDTFQKLMEENGFKDYKKKVEEFYHKANEVTKQKIETVFKNAPRNTMIHNDFHINNMLFIESDDQGITTKVIDWEHSRFGNIYEDITMYLSGSVPDYEEQKKYFLEGYFGDDIAKFDEEVFDLMFLRKKAFLFTFIGFLVNEQNAKMFGGYLVAMFDGLQKMLEKYV